MSVNVEGNVSQISAGNNWFQNVKVGGQQENATPQPKADDAVKVSISQEGIENYRKQLHESSMDGANGKIIEKEDKDSIIKKAKQATNSLSANNYGNELAKETKKLKEQRTGIGTYSLSNQAEDLVRAYGNLYDEIVQGYQKGTRERYVEDETSETGYRKMTMEEELNGLDKAFQRAADETDVEEMIRGEFKRLSSKAGSKETSSTQKSAENNKSKSTADYVKELAKLAPSVELKVGNSYQTAKSGKTLTISPKLLEKMQNDPEQEKETKEMIQGVESMTKLMDGMNKASGWTVVFRHSYIDENGKYCEIALVRNDLMLNLSDKLREERRKNSEKLIEKTKEKSAEKTKELEEMQEEKEVVKTEKEAAEETSAYDKAKQLINDKMAASKDGMIYLNDTDFRTIIEAIKENGAGKATVKEQIPVGANLDLKV